MIYSMEVVWGSAYLHETKLYSVFYKPYTHSQFAYKQEKIPFYVRNSMRKSAIKNLAAFTRWWKKFSGIMRNEGECFKNP